MNGFDVSVITVTLNAMAVIPRLVESLRAQDDKGFIWVVNDGGSSDGTVEYLKSINDLNIDLSIEKDFGIYDALNKAVQRSETEYYVVIGADDYFYSNAIGSFKKKLHETNFSADLVALGWSSNGVNFFPGNNKGWLFGMSGIASCHSVATLIRKELHKRFGFYSPKFPVCADQLFVKKSIYGGCFLVKGKDVVGAYGVDGFSASDAVAVQCDFFRVQLATEKNKVLQGFIFLARMIKNYKIFRG